MKAIDFKKSNKTLNNGNEEVPIWFDNKSRAIMCMEFTEEEIKKLIETKKIWVLFSGNVKKNKVQFNPNVLSIEYPFE